MTDNNKFKWTDDDISRLLLRSKNGGINFPAVNGGILARYLIQPANKQTTIIL